MHCYGSGCALNALFLQDGVRFTFSPCVNYIRGDRKGYIQM